MDFASFIQLLGAQLEDRACDRDNEHKVSLLWWIFRLPDGERIAVLRRSYRGCHVLRRDVDQALVVRLRHKPWEVWNHDKKMERMDF